MSPPRQQELFARTGVGSALGLLWVCGLFATVVFGAVDVSLHAPRLRWFEAGEILALYALFGGLAAAAALPVAALLLLIVRPWLGLGRGAGALLWMGLSATVLVSCELRVLNLWAALIALALAAIVAARASALRSFERTGRWRIRRGLVVMVILALAVAPPIGRRVAAAGGGRIATGRGGPPDVVLVVLDTQRADHLGAYGDRRGLSPAFDAFASEGALYLDCFSSAPWTVPSHASMFTALEPPTHGCSFEHHRWLDHRFVTLAEALKQRGYQTAAFVANDYLVESNLLQGFDSQERVGARWAALAIKPVLELLGWPARYADHGATDAIERIDRFLARERDDEKPLFLFVNLLETHWRNLPPLAERWKQTQPEPGLIESTDVSRRFYGPLVMAGKPVPGPLAPSIRALYAAAVQYQDARLGELLTRLAARLEFDRSVIAVTADHGENLGEGGRWDHVFALNDALLHVPLAIRFPPSIAPGTKVSGLCELVDLPVTLRALASRDGEAKLAENVAGRTLEPTHFQPREFVLGFGDPYLGHLEAMANWSGFNRDVLGFAALQRSIRDGKHKLVRSSAHGDELFDLAADRDETRDVGSTDPTTRDALRAQLERELAKLPPYEGPPQRPPQDADPDPIDRDALRHLGYVGAGK